MHERRLGYRIPFESMVTSYVHDRPIRGLAQNLSDSGMLMSAISMVAPPPGLVIGLEIDLPGTNDSIWAAGRVCYRQDDSMASGLGVWVFSIWPLPASSSEKRMFLAASNS